MPLLFACISRLHKDRICHPMKDSFDVSLIICTRNRASALRECLDKIAAIKSQLRWELVVVDNNSSDNTADVIREFAAQAPMPVRYALETRQGLGVARNCGWKHASAPIL